MRMGTSKQLLRLGTKSVIRHCVDPLVAAGITEIIVVSGADHDAYAGELNGTGARIVRNNAQDSQMADSVRVGLRALGAGCSGVFVGLADHPLVGCATYRTMVTAHHQSSERIIIPAFQGKRGHPSLFPLPVISGIFLLPILRDLIREQSDRLLVVDVPDAGVVLDMDTKEDYRSIAEKFAMRTDGLQAGGRQVKEA